MEGLEEFKASLKKVKNWQDDVIVQGMEIGANRVVTHMKENHRFVGPKGKGISPAERRIHADKRFYTWSEKTVNSMRAGEVKMIWGGIMIEVFAGSPSMRWVADLEVGTANRRAFPFMQPALTATRKINFQDMAARLKGLYG